MEKVKKNKINEGQDPIRKQTNIVLDMVKDTLSYKIEELTDYISYLKEQDDKCEECLKSQHIERFEMQYLTDMINDLQKNMEVA